MPAIPELSQKELDDGYSWCSSCEKALPPAMFTPNGIRTHVCRECRSKYDHRQRVSRIRAAYKRELNDEMLMLECRMCGLTKIESEFSTRGAVSNGRDRFCRVCKRTVDKAFRASHREELATRQRARRAASKKMRQEQALRDKTARAVRAGKLTIPKVCGCCGGSENLRVHHPRYDGLESHLNVKVICEQCHSRKHRGKHRRVVFGKSEFACAG